MGVNFQPNALEAFMARSKKVKLPVLINEEQRKQFLALAGQMSPENVSHDGERSKTQIKKAMAGLRRQWKDLEKQVGRKVTNEDVYGARPAEVEVKAPEVPAPGAKLARPTQFVIDYLRKVVQSIPEGQTVTVDLILVTSEKVRPGLTELQRATLAAFLPSVQTVILDGGPLPMRDGWLKFLSSRNLVEAAWQAFRAPAPAVAAQS